MSQYGTSRTPSPLQVFHRHVPYYLDDGVVFSVQNTLFKVPRYIFTQESSIFNDMFRLPTSGQAEGDTDNAPIRLTQVEALDFERLLELLYPISFVKLMTGTKNWGEAEWTSILHLATRWEMDNIRSHAIVELSSCAAPTSKITLGRKYNYPEWLRNGLVELCLQPETLTTKELEQLSLKEIAGIGKARERMKAEVIQSSCSQAYIMTKYGEAQVYQTDYHNYLPYDEHPMVHQILDEIFDLQIQFVRPPRTQSVFGDC